MSILRKTLTSPFLKGMRSPFGFGSVDELLQYLFNGLTPPDSYTGGALWVSDYQGTLVSAGADQIAVPGARLDWTGWQDWKPDMTSVYAADNDFIGVAYDTATDTFERLGAAKGEPVGTLPSGFMNHQVFNRLRRVVLQDNVEVYKGIRWDDLTKHEDGTDVDLTGGNGQIMTEYLPAYVAFFVDGTKQITLLSDKPQPGFVMHPVFVGGQPVYNGAYEASVYNDGSGDKLCSIARDPSDGVSPVYPVTDRTGAWGYSGLTTEAGDTLAEARGPGWQQYDFLTANYERLLMLVGFASYDIPGIVGVGRTYLTDGGWTNGVNIGQCGLGDIVGGYHSAVQAGGTAGYDTDYAQVLGIENPWGNVWKRMVALVEDWKWYYKPLPPYDYGSTAGWTRLLDAQGVGITCPDSIGYGGVPHSGLGLMLPADVTGSSSTRMHDYYYQASGLRAPLVGGHATDGANAGPFCVSTNYSAESAFATVGGRLSAKKGGA